MRHIVSMESACQEETAETARNDRDATIGGRQGTEKPDPDEPLNGDIEWLKFC